LSPIIAIPIRAIPIGIISVGIISVGGVFVGVVYITISVWVAVSIRVGAEVAVVTILGLSVAPPRPSLSSGFLISVDLARLAGFLVLTLL
jgi:hypothetical protein